MSNYIILTKILVVARKCKQNMNNLDIVGNNHVSLFEMIIEILPTWERKYYSRGVTGAESKPLLYITKKESNCFWQYPITLCIADIPILQCIPYK